MTPTVSALPKIGPQHTYTSSTRSKKSLAKYMREWPALPSHVNPLHQVKNQAPTSPAPIKKENVSYIEKSSLSELTSPLLSDSDWEGFHAPKATRNSLSDAEFFKKYHHKDEPVYNQSPEHNNEWPELPTPVNPQTPIKNQTVKDSRPKEEIRSVRPKKTYYSTEYFPPFFSSKTNNNTLLQNTSDIEEDDTDSYLNRFDEMDLQMRIKGKHRDGPTPQRREARIHCSNNRQDKISQRIERFFKKHNKPLPSCSLASSFEDTKKEILKKAVQARRSATLEKYEELFHLEPTLPKNAAPYTPIPAAKTQNPIRKVYLIDLSLKTYYQSEVDKIIDQKFAAVRKEVNLAKKQSIIIDPIFDYYPPGKILDDVGLEKFEDEDHTKVNLSHEDELNVLHLDKLDSKKSRKYHFGQKHPIKVCSLLREANKAHSLQQKCKATNCPIPSGNPSDTAELNRRFKALRKTSLQ